MLKVVHLSRGFGDYVISLARELAGKVYFHVVLAEADEWMVPKLPAGVDVRLSRAPRVTSPSNVVAMYRIQRWIRDVKPDVIHVQNGVIWEAAFLALNPAVPVVTTLHDVTRHPFLRTLHGTPQSILDLVARRSDALIVHGKALAEQAAIRYRRDGDLRPRVIPHPIISRYGIGQCREEAEGNILFFGRLERYKGISTLLKAMEIARRSNSSLKLRICGETTEPNHYERLMANNSGVEWSMRKQEDDEVAALFRWADVVVLPYIEASQSGVLYVAASFGVPVVATRVGSLSEVVRDGCNGLLAEPGDPQALADALLRIVRDTELRSRLLKQIVAERERLLQERLVGAATLEVYKKVTAGS